MKKNPTSKVIVTDDCNSEYANDILCRYDCGDVHDTQPETAHQCSWDVSRRDEPPDLEGESSENLNACNAFDPSLECIESCHENEAIDTHDTLTHPPMTPRGLGILMRSDGKQQKPALDVHSYDSDSSS